MNTRCKFFSLLLIIVVYLIFVNYILETHVDLPEGTWKDTCEVISWNNPELTAQCVDNQGKIITSTINLDSCVEIELDPNQVEKRNEGRELEHRHYPGNKGSYLSLIHI
jgi:hypothetical protein